MDDSNNNLSFRKVIKTDEILLFDWTNDPDVRRWSTNKKSITLDEHKVWFNQKINNENVFMWIFEDDKSPVGIVRLEKNNSEFILNYQIESKVRRKGLASQMLIIAMIKLRSLLLNASVLGYKFHENISSIKSMEKRGLFCRLIVT